MKVIIHFFIFFFPPPMQNSSNQTGQSLACKQVSQSWGRLISCKFKCLFGSVLATLMYRQEQHDRTRTKRRCAQGPIRATPRLHPRAWGNLGPCPSSPILFSAVLRHVLEAVLDFLYQQNWFKLRHPGPVTYEFLQLIAK